MLRLFICFARVTFDYSVAYYVHYYVYSLYEITPRSVVLLERLTVTQMVKTFPEFYGI